MDINNLLDNAQHVCSAKNASELATTLGISRQALSSYRNGHRFPDIVICEKLSKMTGIKLLSVVAMVNEQREVSRDAKAVWRRLANAAAVLILVGMSTPGAATVLSVNRDRVSPTGAESSTIYALCEVHSQALSGDLRESARPCVDGAAACVPCVRRPTPGPNTCRPSNSLDDALGGLDDVRLAEILESWFVSIRNQAFVSSADELRWRTGFSFVSSVVTWLSKTTLPTERLKQIEARLHRLSHRVGLGPPASIAVGQGPPYGASIGERD